MIVGGLVSPLVGGENRRIQREYREMAGSSLCYAVGVTLTLPRSVFRPAFLNAVRARCLQPPAQVQQPKAARLALKYFTPKIS